MKTNRQLQRLQSSYSAALHGHVNERTVDGLRKAKKLGIRALKLGLGALDLAHLHEGALSSLLEHVQERHRHDEAIGQACVFFAQALHSIEARKMLKQGRAADRQLQVIMETLTARTLQLVAANADLKKEVEHRHAIEASLRESDLKSTQLLEKSRRMQEDLRMLSRRILSAQEEERKTISRELHDVIAQNLTSVHVRLEALSSRSGADTRAMCQRIKTTQKLLEKSVDKIHRFARDLRPALLDDLGLIPAMQTWMKGYTHETGVRTALRVQSSVEKLDISARTTLYRIAQEAMTNVALHAKASQVRASISLSRKEVHMQITDDGCGFHVDDIALIKRGRRLGLLGMRERAEMAGGSLCIDSTPGGGTTVHVRIPHESGRAPRHQTNRTCDPGTLRCE